MDIFYVFLYVINRKNWSYSFFSIEYVKIHFIKLNNFFIIDF